MGDYRNDARRQLRRAKDELASGDDQRLKYAALELREAMEALTYDRALAYGDEFPPEEYETWQPKKVMGVLLDIDPNADKDSTLAFGEEPGPGEEPPVMHVLGTEKVLNMKTLKKHYDALGSYLHVQSLKQRRSGVELDYSAMRGRCGDIAAFIDDVLKSPVFNSTMGNFAEMECGKCGGTIRKRLPHGAEKVSARCRGCGVTYTVTDAGANQSRWQPDQVELTCANQGCGTRIFAFRSEVELNAAWDCDGCGGRNVLRLGVSYIPPADAPTAGEDPRAKADRIVTAA